MDRAQCDASADFIMAGSEPGLEIHAAVMEKTVNQIFVCLEDVLFANESE